MFDIILVRPSINLISMSDLLIRKILHKQHFMKVRTLFFALSSIDINNKHVLKKVRLINFQFIDPPKSRVSQNSLGHSFAQFHQNANSRCDQICRYVQKPTNIANRQ